MTNKKTQLFTNMKVEDGKLELSNMTVEERLVIMTASTKAATPNTLDKELYTLMWSPQVSIQLESVDALLQGLDEIMCDGVGALSQDNMSAQLPQYHATQHLFSIAASFYNQISSIVE